MTKVGADAQAMGKINFVTNTNYFFRYRKDSTERKFSIRNIMKLKPYIFVRRNLIYTVKKNVGTFPDDEETFT